MSETKNIVVIGDEDRAEFWELEAGKDALGDMIDSGLTRQDPGGAKAVDDLAAELRKRREGNRVVRASGDAAVHAAHQDIQEAGTAELEGTRSR